jgi:hypothetical protein
MADIPSWRIVGSRRRAERLGDHEEQRLDHGDMLTARWGEAQGWSIEAFRAATALAGQRSPRPWRWQSAAGGRGAERDRDRGLTTATAGFHHDDDR